MGPLQRAHVHQGGYFEGPDSLILSEYNTKMIVLISQLKSVSNWLSCRGPTSIRGGYFQGPDSLISSEYNTKTIVLIYQLKSLSNWLSCRGPTSIRGDIFKDLILLFEGNIIHK